MSSIHSHNFEDIILIHENKYWLPKDRLKLGNELLQPADSNWVDWLTVALCVWSLSSTCVCVNMPCGSIEGPVQHSFLHCFENLVLLPFIATATYMQINFPLWPPCLLFDQLFAASSTPSATLFFFISSHFVHVTVLQSCQLSNSSVCNTRWGCSSGGHLQLNNVNPVISRVSKYTRWLNFILTCLHKSQAGKVR